MIDNMTRTLTSNLEDLTHLLVQDQRNNNNVEQSKEPVKDEILQEIRDFSFNGDDSSEPDEDSITIFDVFDLYN